MSLTSGRETMDMVPVGLGDMAVALIIELLYGPLNIQTDTGRSLNQDRSCYLSGQEKMITVDLWVSTAFRYQPQQQQRQRLQRLLFVVLDVVFAAVEVVGGADVVAAVAEHGP